MRKIISLLLSVCIFLSMSVIASAGYENVEQPIFMPVDKGDLGDLLEEKTKTYTDGDFTFVDVEKTYKYDFLTRRGEEKFYKETSRTVYVGGMVAYGVMTLDADFYCDPVANTVTCDRYYSSYLEYVSMEENPHETDADFTSGKTYPMQRQWYKISTTCKYLPSSASPIGQLSFKMNLGCDSGGGDY